MSWFRRKKKSVGATGACGGYGPTGTIGPVCLTGPIGPTGSAGSFDTISRTTRRILQCITRRYRRHPRVRYRKLEDIIMRADPDISDDERTFLVQEYLRLLDVDWPEGHTHLICDAL